MSLTLEQVNSSVPNNIDLAKNNKYLAYLKKIEEAGTKFRTIHELFSSLIECKIIINVAFSDFISKLQVPAKQTLFLKLVDCVLNIPKIYKSTIKFETSTGFKKFINAIKLVEASSSFMASINYEREGMTIYTGAAKVKGALAKVFSTFICMCSGASIILNARRICIADSNLFQLIQAVGPHEKGVYSVQNYTQLLKHLQGLTDKSLGKRFGVNGKKLFEQLQRLEINFKNQSVLTPDQNKEVKEIIKLLKNRLEVQRKEKIFDLIEDSFHFIGGILVIASVANPAFILIWTAFYLITPVVRYIIQQVQTYQFENKIGMIERPITMIPSSSFAFHLKDFLMWQFDFYSKDENKQNYRLS
jgi:hypothetical protein